MLIRVLIRVLISDTLCTIDGPMVESRDLLGSWYLLFAFFLIDSLISSIALRSSRIITEIQSMNS